MAILGLNGDWKEAVVRILLSTIPARTRDAAPCTGLFPGLPSSSGHRLVFIFLMIVAVVPESLSTCRCCHSSQKLQPFCVFGPTSTRLARALALEKNSGPPALLGHLVDGASLPPEGASSVPTLTLPPVPQPLGLLLFFHHITHFAPPESLHLPIPLAGRSFLPDTHVASSLPLFLQVFTQVSPCQSGLPLTTFIK